MKRITLLLVSAVIGCGGAPDGEERSVAPADTVESTPTPAPTATASSKPMPTASATAIPPADPPDAEAPDAALDADAGPSVEPPPPVEPPEASAPEAAPPPVATPDAGAPDAQACVSLPKNSVAQGGGCSGSAVWPYNSDCGNYPMQSFEVTCTTAAAFYSDQMQIALTIGPVPCVTGGIAPEPGWAVYFCPAAAICAN